MKYKVAPKLGDGSTFTSLGKILPFPAHIISKLSKWHRINLLNNKSDKETIVSIYPYSNRPEDVKRLFDLIDYHYGFDLFRSIDAAKKDLSENCRATVEFYPLDLREQITITEFEKIIGATALK